MARQKHKPQRTCIGCRETKEKRDLLRIVRTPEQRIVVDSIGKVNGRGVYLCRNEACITKGLTKEKIAQALKVKLLADEIADLRISVQNVLPKAK